MADIQGLPSYPPSEFLPGPVTRGISERIPRGRPAGMGSEQAQAPAMPAGCAAAPVRTNDEFARRVAAVTAAGTTLVMGIGNILQGDDGAGVHAIRRLERNLRGWPGLNLYDAGTLGAILLIEIEQAERLVFIDAMRMQAPPGTVRCFEGEAMDRWLTRRKAGSVHEVGLGELLDLARLQERLPIQRALIGIEPGYIGWGDTLSGDVAGALDEVERLVRGLLRSWADANA